MESEERRGVSDPKDPEQAVEDLLRSALAAHQAGRLAEAETLCRQILARYPGDANTLFLLGVLALQTARYQAAAESFAQAISATPAPPAEFHYHFGLAWAHLGKTDEAERHFRRALATSPDLVEGYNGLGNVLKEQGRADEAAQCYRRALELCPTSAVAHHNLGVLLQEQGKLDEAIAHYRQAAQLDPVDGAMRCSLANGLRAANRFAEAIAAYEAAIALAPNLIEPYVGLGGALEEAGKPDAAAKLYEDVLTRHADSPELYVRLGDVYRCLARPRDAERAYRSALRAGPEHAPALYRLGQVMEDAGALSEAEALYGRMLELRPDVANAHLNLAQVLEDRGRILEAERAVRRALALEPGLAPAHLALGNILKDQGRHAEAGEAYRAALRLRKECAEAYTSLASLAKYSSAEHPDLQDVLRLLRAPGLAETSAMHLHFAAGKMLDDCAAYDDAFAHYREGNRIRHQSCRFDASGFTELVERILRQFSVEFLAERSEYCGSNSELPVFIVGMPRSGTTLVEQIIASHRQVYGAGELTKMRELAMGLGARLGTTASYPEAVAALGPELTRSVAHEYEVVLSEGADEGAVRVSDKIPINFLYLGLIALLFPRARVIHCRRDPLDVCLSIYFQYFRHGNDYAYDLADIGCFYRGYERIMAHWRAALPLRLYELHYEELVDDQAQQTRKLIAFLDLPWDDRCLAFERNPRPVQTASAWQVRQPIYRSSIGRWRNYDKHLGPLREALGLENP